MAGEEEREEVAESGGGGGAKLMLIIGLVNTAGLLGLAAFVVLGGGGASSAPMPGIGDEVAALEEARLRSGRIESGEPGPMIELGTLVVNLREPGGDRYLKTRLQLELDAEGTRSEVEARMSQIRYQVTMLLSGQRVADVQGPDSMEALRKSMIRRANAVLSKGKIVGVWPDEWIVQ